MFETSGCPWKEHLFNIEEKLGIKGEILYVIYKNKETDWRIQVKKSTRITRPPILPGPLKNHLTKNH